MARGTSFRHRPSSIDAFSTTSGSSNSSINGTTSTSPPEVQSNDYDSDVSYEEVNQFGFGTSNDDKSSGIH